MKLYCLASSFNLVCVRKGWPEFHVFTLSGRFICIKTVDSLKRSIRFDLDKVMRALAAHGVPCYLYSPDEGFVQIDEHGAMTPRSNSEVFA